MRKGIANLPLHHGKAPPWLFNRMVRLSESMVEFIVLEHGRETLLRWLSDPFWFQSLGCVLGFDWHSSGLTTTVCGALKEALKKVGPDVGVFMAGGKGRTALRTPEELDSIGDRFGIDAERLKDVSRITAKVDNVLLQDGYQLYHHVVVFTADGKWAVVQQGMNTESRYARRYHWLGEDLESFVQEPHSGISAQKVHERITLDLTSRDSHSSREAVKELVSNGPRRHYVTPEDFDLRKLRETVEKAQRSNIGSFEDILRLRGVGPKTVRALVLVAELLYGAKPSFEDPARYSFAHGGKDGHPYPFRRDIYDATIETLKRAIEKAKVGQREKVEAIKRLSRILND